jgi:hypothetical protein
MPFSIQQLLAPKLSPVKQALKEFLDKDKSGELFSSSDLADKNVCGHDSITKAARSPEFADYVFRRGGRCWLGKPALIAEFKKALTKVSH